MFKNNVLSDHSFSDDAAHLYIGKATIRERVRDESTQIPFIQYFKLNETLLSPILQIANLSHLHNALFITEKVSLRTHF